MTFKITAKEKQLIIRRRALSDKPAWKHVPKVQKKKLSPTQQKIKALRAQIQDLNQKKFPLILEVKRLKKQNKAEKLAKKISH